MDAFASYLECAKLWAIERVGRVADSGRTIPRFKLIADEDCKASNGVDDVLVAGEHVEIW